MNTRQRLMRTRINLLAQNRWFPTYRFEEEHRDVLTCPTCRDLEKQEWKRRAREEKLARSGS